VREPSQQPIVNVIGVPRQTFVHTAAVPAPPDTVWLGLQRPEAWARIGGVERIVSPLIDPAGDLVGYDFIAMAGGQSHIGSARRMHAERGRVLVMAIDSDQIEGSISIELEPTAPATLVTVAMTVGTKGFLAAVMFPLVVSSIASGFNEAVEEFVSGLV
jgi:hypothetical protein